MSIDATQFPQLARMQAVQEQSQAIGEFIEWLGENGMAICTSNAGLRGESFYPVAVSSEEMLARHFGFAHLAEVSHRLIKFSDLFQNRTVDAVQLKAVKTNRTFTRQFGGSHGGNKAVKTANSFFMLAEKAFVGVLIHAEDRKGGGRGGGFAGPYP